MYKFFLIVNFIVFVLFFTVVLYYNSRNRKTKTALIESEERYLLLFKNFPDSIIIHRNGLIIFANHAALELTGVRYANDLEKKSIFNFFTLDDKIFIRDSLIQLREGNVRSVTHEHKLIRNDNAVIDVEVTSSAISLNGEYLVQSVLRNIKEKKLLNETLELDKLKSRFFSNISHELRTPINGMLSTIQLSEFVFENKNISEYIYKLKYNFQVIKKNCYRMLKIINNIVDVAKIDSGYFEIYLKNVDIVGIVEDITLSVAQVAANNQLNVVFDTDTEEKIIACDPSSIERIMLNLLSNAIKFSGPGGNIAVNFFDREDNIFISVKDTGIGIPHDKTVHVFNQFFQVDNSFSRKNEGSGIGLFLVKSLVEMHKGSVSVNSNIGEGSEFVIKLPSNILPKQDNLNTTCGSYKSQFLSSKEKVNMELSDIYSLYG